MRRALMTALAATILSTATPVFAQSATVNGAPLTSGGSTTIHFGGPAGTTASADLFLMLTSADTTTGKYDFSYTFTNTNASVSDLTGFGFTTTPTLMGVSGGSTDALKWVLNPVNFPGGYDVDACAYSGNNCDAANGKGDLFMGTFELTFAGSTTSITLDNFVDRYAALTQLNGISGEGTPTTNRAVPEPATWALMLLGFGGIGMSMRRSRKSKPALMQVA